MDKETYEKHKPFAGEKKPSMQRRCVGHDYQGRQMYLITMVTEGRKPLLGRLTGRSDAPAGSDDAPRVVLTELGDRVRREWWLCSQHHPEIEVIALQLMPDHLHGILFVREHMEVPLGMALRGFKQSCNRHYRELMGGGFAALTTQQTETTPQTGTAPQKEAQAEAQAQTTQQKEAQAEAQAQTAPQKEAQAEAQAQTTPQKEAPAEAQAQTGTTPQKKAPAEAQAQAGTGQQAEAQAPAPAQAKTRKGEDRSKGLLFARGYNDRLLVRAGQLDVWCHYLDDNPRRLLMKREHPDLFRVQRNVMVGTQSFSAIGNRFLLERPVRLAVRCSRRLTQAEIAEQVDYYVAQGKGGAVLVSPSISPGEKAVMRAAFDAGLPLILLQENGFTDLAKPGGKRMEACSEGRLLIMAPWEHHNEHLAISRSQCMELNAMAQLICDGEGHY